MDRACYALIFAALITGIGPALFSEATQLDQESGRVPGGAVVTLYAEPNFGGESVSLACVLNRRQFHLAVKFNVSSVRVRVGFTAWISSPAGSLSELPAGHVVNILHGEVADVDARWKGGVIGIEALCASVVNDLELCPEGAAWPNAPCATVLVTAGGAHEHPTQPEKPGSGKLADGHAAGGESPPPSKGALKNEILAEAIGLVRDGYTAPAQGAGDSGTGTSQRDASDHAAPDADGIVSRQSGGNVQVNGGGGLDSKKPVDALSDKSGINRERLSNQLSPWEQLPLTTSADDMSADGFLPVSNIAQEIPQGCLDQCPADLVFRDMRPPSTASITTVGMGSRSRKLLKHHKEEPEEVLRPVTHRLGVVVVFCTDHGYKRILDELSCDNVDVVIYSKCGNQPTIHSKLRPCTIVNAGENSPAGVNALSILEHLYLYYDRLHEVTLFLKDTLPNDIRKHVWDVVAAIEHNRVGYYAFTEAIRDMLVQDMKEFYLTRMNDTEFVPSVLSALQCTNSSFHGVPAYTAHASKSLTAPELAVARSRHFSWQTPFVVEDCKKVSSRSRGRAELRPRDLLHCGDPLATAWATDYWRTAVHSVFAVARNRVWMWPQCKYAGFATYIKDWFNRSTAPLEQKGQASWWLFERIWGEIFHCRPARHHDRNFVCLGDELVASQETLDDLPHLLKPKPPSRRTTKPH